MPKTVLWKVLFNPLLNPKALVIVISVTSAFVFYNIRYIIFKNLLSFLHSLDKAGMPCYIITVLIVIVQFVNLGGAECFSLILKAVCQYATRL